jgi:hypothetical protein
VGDYRATEPLLVVEVDADVCFESSSAGVMPPPIAAYAST